MASSSPSSSSIIALLETHHFKKHGTKRQTDTYKGMYICIYQVNQKGVGCSRRQCIGNKELESTAPIEISLFKSSKAWSGIIYIQHCSNMRRRQLAWNWKSHHLPIACRSDLPVFYEDITCTCWSASLYLQCSIFSWCCCWCLWWWWWWWLWLVLFVWDRSMDGSSLHF